MARTAVRVEEGRALIRFRGRYDGRCVVVVLELSNVAGIHVSNLVSEIVWAQSVQLDLSPEELQDAELASGLFAKRLPAGIGVRRRLGPSRVRERCPVVDVALGPSQIEVSADTSGHGRRGRHPGGRARRPART